MSNIGCAEEYTVNIVRQPGNMTAQGSTPAVLGQPDEILSLEYGRVLSDISNATLVVSGCAHNARLFSPELNLSGVRPWAYELWIYRDGEIAWQGPIVHVRASGKSSFTIIAHDVIRYTDRREIVNFYSITNDPVDIAENLVTTFFPADDPLIVSNIVKLNNPTAVLSVEYDRAQYVIYQKWRDLKEAGLNYTTMVRNICLMGTPPNMNNPYLINVSDIQGEPEIVLDGIDYGNHIVVLGEGIAAGVGPGASDRAFFGKITFPPTRLQDVKDQTQLNNLAVDFFNDKVSISPELVIPAGSTLTSGTEIYNLGYHTNNLGTTALRDLFCGLRYDVQVGEDSFWRPGNYPMRLGEVLITWSPDDGERVAVSLSTLPTS